MTEHICVMYREAVASQSPGLPLRLPWEQEMEGFNRKRGCAPMLEFVDAQNIQVSRLLPQPRCG